MADEPATRPQGQDLDQEAAADEDGVAGAGLEAVTRAAAGLIDPEDHIQVVHDMMRRVARIEIGGRPVGTGVLVAPDVVLTASHAVGAALESGRLPDSLRLVSTSVRPPAPNGPHLTSAAYGCS